MSCQGAVSPKGARKLHDADVVYLYDGSFEGFLCCVYESFAQHELPFAVWTQFYKTLEIKARHNEKGRMTHCPKRFWADMVELQGEL